MRRCCIRMQSFRAIAPNRMGLKRLGCCAAKRMTNTIRVLTVFTLMLTFVPRSDAQRVHRPAPNAIEACMEVAGRRTQLPTAQKVRLCNAAPSALGPVDCFVEASGDLALTDVQAVALCRCSASNEPVACFRRVRAAERITPGEIITRCSPATLQDLGFDCRPRG